MLSRQTAAEAAAAHVADPSAASDYPQAPAEAIAGAVTAGAATAAAGAAAVSCASAGTSRKACALVDAQSGSRQSRQNVDARIVMIVKSERAVPEHKKAKTETRARAKRRGHSRKTSGPSMAELLAHSAKKKAKR